MITSKKGLSEANRTRQWNSLLIRMIRNQQNVNTELLGRFWVYKIPNLKQFLKDIALRRGDRKQISRKHFAKNIEGGWVAIAVSMALSMRGIADSSIPKLLGRHFSAES